jgi:hypothetical protein
MNSETIRALTGCNLSETEFLKIDKTVLSEVIAEEPNFKAVTHIPKEKPSKPEKEEKAEDEDGELTLDEEKELNELLNETTKPKVSSANKSKDDFDLFKFIQEEKLKVSEVKGLFEVIDLIYIRTSVGG